MMVLKVLPEQFAQAERQRPQRDVVDDGLAFAQVVDQQIPHRAADEVVAVDHLLDADLAFHPAGDSTHGRRGAGGNTPTMCSSW